MSFSLPFAISKLVVSAGLTMGIFTGRLGVTLWPERKKQQWYSLIVAHHLMFLQPETTGSG